MEEIEKESKRLKRWSAFSSDDEATTTSKTVERETAMGGGVGEVSLNSSPGVGDAEQDPAKAVEEEIMAHAPSQFLLSYAADLFDHVANSFISKGLFERSNHPFKIARLLHKHLPQGSEKGEDPWRGRKYGESLQMLVQSQEVWCSPRNQHPGRLPATVRSLEVNTFTLKSRILY
jgi:hypothetical protein